jgi:uncharacterized protein (DUF4415 family)
MYLKTKSGKEVYLPTDEEDKIINAGIDDENPEWTEEMFAKAVRVKDLPTTVQSKLRNVRGRQKVPTKERITIRLSPDVVSNFRATGAGWQTRIDAALRDWLKMHQVG